MVLIEAHHGAARVILQYKTKAGMASMVTHNHTERMVNRWVRFHRAPCETNISKGRWVGNAPCETNTQSAWWVESKCKK